MNRRLSGDASLNAPLREEGEGEWQDWLVDDVVQSGKPAGRIRRGRQSPRRPVAGARRAQRPRAADFRGAPSADDPITLEDLSTEFGISRERVRQIEVRAFEKVQQAVRDRVARVENLPRPPLPLRGARA